MPSPIGHALAGLIAGSLVSLPRQDTARWMTAYAAAGMAADLDLFVGAHSGPSHGIGAALIVGAVTWAILRRGRVHRRAITACAMAVAYASHTLLAGQRHDAADRHHGAVAIQAAVFRIAMARLHGNFAALLVTRVLDVQPARARARVADSRPACPTRVRDAAEIG